MHGCILAQQIFLANSGMADLNGWVEARLSGGGSSIAAWGLLFLGGLLASLLPCVYPLYPITASIIRNRSQGSPFWLHPIAYYAGLVSIYAIFGIVAVASGGTFNVVLRLGLTNILLAVVFSLLALSTAGWLHLPLFQGRTVSVRPGLVGTTVLGGAAGMLSSACVGPVVVSVLLRLATHSESGSSVSHVANGAAQMALFGSGVGIPLLCVALFGVSLPKSGSWLVGIQYLLAALIFYFAFGYLEKGLASLEFPRSAASTIASCTMAFIMAGTLVQSKQIEFERRLWRAILGFVLFVSAAIMFRTIQPPMSGTSSNIDSAEMQSPTYVERDGDLSWYVDESKAYEDAAERGQNVFVDFYGPWCSNCKEFQKLTHSDAELNAALKKVTLLKVYDRKPLFQKYKEDARFPELKIGLPFFVITDSKKNLLYKTNDYLKTDEMLLFLSD